MSRHIKSPFIGPITIVQSKIYIYIILHLFIYFLILLYCNYRFLSKQLHKLYFASTLYFCFLITMNVTWNFVSTVQYVVHFCFLNFIFVWLPVSPSVLSINKKGLRRLIDKNYLMSSHDYFTDETSSRKLPIPWCLHKTS